MPMPEQVMKDLCRLAADRCRRVLDDIGQLVEHDQERWWLAVNTVANLIGDAADLMQDAMTKKNGEPPERDKVLGFMLNEILKAHDIDIRDKKYEEVLAKYNEARRPR